MKLYNSNLALVQDIRHLGMTGQHNVRLERLQPRECGAKIVGDLRVGAIADEDVPRNRDAAEEQHARRFAVCDDRGAPACAARCVAGRQMRRQCNVAEADCFAVAAIYLGWKNISGASRIACGG